MDTIHQADAILDLSDPAQPKEPEWPQADVIIGNPPFLGYSPLRDRLGDQYVDALFNLYGDRLPNFSDYCCYWFEKGRAMVEQGKAKRVGLLATQAIRNSGSRQVLQRIKGTGDIFLAYPDRPWMLDGATVNVSIVGFDDGSESYRTLDGDLVAAINPNLTTGVDLTKARKLKENLHISFVGDMKKGKFEIDCLIAKEMLATTGNPNERPNSDVLKTWSNGMDITGRSRGMWIIDFPPEISEFEASQYELPFEHIRKSVKPVRDKVRNPLERRRWWVHGRTAPDMRQALQGLNRYIATVRVAKHRLFVFLPTQVLPDGQLVVVAREDDYTFGVLHSRVHEVWALQMGTQLESRPRYTPTTTFETFPFPEPTEGQRDAVAEAARELNRYRENWLNPVTPDGKPALSLDDLKKRTLTNLYNQRPAWLDNAHKNLDAAVFAAYGWTDGLADQEILERLLELNLGRPTI